MAKGSFLVSQGGGRGDDRPGPRRRHRLHRLEERGRSPGPNNIAYSAAKADQAHQVRLLAAELGEHGIRVNGVNPDGVVRGSGIFAGGWGAQRAAVYGVPEEELGAFYAQRTLLKREVLPEHVASAVAALTSDELQPHHRPARPRRRRRRRRVPPVGRWPRRVFAAVDIGASGGRVMAGVVDGEHVDARGGAPLPERGASSATVTCGGTSPASSTRCSTASRGWPGAIPEVESIGIDTWGVDYGLLDADGRAARRPDRLPRRPHRRRSIDEVHAAGPARRALRDQRPAVPAVQHDLPARRRDGRAARGTAAAHVVLLPDLLAYWLTGELRDRGDQRLDHRAARRAHRAVVERAARPARHPSRPVPADRAPGHGPGHRPARPRERARAAGSTVVVTTVGSHDTASAVVGVPADEPTVRLRRQRHLVARRPRARPRRSLTDGSARRRTSPTRAGSTAAPASSATSAGSGCCRSRCGRGPTRAASRPRRAPGRGRGAARRRADASTSTTTASSRPATCPTASPPPPATSRSPPIRRAITRCIVDSLAGAYAAHGRRGRRPRRTPPSTSSTSSAAARRTSCSASSPPTAAGLPVTAGPVEATALGNVLVQARAHGAAPGTLEELRAMVAAGSDIRTYTPRAQVEALR